MAVIIGALTTINIDGVVSAQWALQPQINRLWELGSWDPYKTVVTTLKTISLTTYAGAISTKDLSPSNSCSDSGATLDVNIDPETCGAAVTGIDDTFYLTSYSYSKGDHIGYGQESWNGQTWVAYGGSTGDLVYIGTPTYVLEGPSEGSSSGDVANKGIVFNTGAAQVDGSQGSVSAGFPGIGQADTTTHGIIERVGGGTLKEDGKIGQGNATIPRHPLWL
jgi:hypothetical protein